MDESREHMIYKREHQLYLFRQTIKRLSKDSESLVIPYASSVKTQETVERDFEIRL